MHTMEVVSMVLHIITCVIGIPGNAIVIWIAGVKMKRTVNTIWYVNLAVADLLCCLIIPGLMARLVLDNHFPFGTALCKIIPAVMGINMFASVFILTMISLDRFTLVSTPVWAKNHRSIFGARLLCGLAWFLALLLSLPELIFRQLTEDNNRTVCSYTDNKLAIKASHVSRSVFGFVIPLLVISVCYLLIARRVSVGRFKPQKALQIMVGVVTAFFVCWTPFYILGLVKIYGKGSSVEVAWAVEPLANSLACLNSCLNPVLYVFMGQNFRERVRVSLHHIFENAFNENTTCNSEGCKRAQVTNSSLEMV